MPQGLYYAISFVLVFCITVCVVSIIVILLRPAPKAPRPPCEQLQLLGRKELAFYKELRIIADTNKLLVFAKVRLAELVRVERGNDLYAEWVKRSKSVCVDFALCEPGSFKTILIVQLRDEDRDRARGENWNRDILELCDAAGVSVLVAEDVSPEALERVLSAKIGTQIRRSVVKKKAS